MIQDGTKYSHAVFPDLSEPAYFLVWAFSLTAFGASAAINVPFRSVYPVFAYIYCLLGSTTFTCAGIILISSCFIFEECRGSPHLLQFASSGISILLPQPANHIYFIIAALFLSYCAPGNY